MHPRFPGAPNKGDQIINVPYTIYNYSPLRLIFLEGLLSITI